MEFLIDGYEYIGEWRSGRANGKGKFTWPTGAHYDGEFPHGEMKGFSSDGSFFAIKQVSLLEQDQQGSNKEQCIHHLQQEIELLSQLKHKNIVRYLGSDKDDSNVYIFLELITQGSIASIYKEHPIDDSQASTYARQILLGLKYLHDKNVIHRDIKCANILVTANGTAKLADFGLAKVIRLSDVMSWKGTPFWMAPEVVRYENQRYGLPADIWSLGCTVLEMLTRKIPYHGLECNPALFKIWDNQLPGIPDSLSSDARNFIRQCLSVNPDKRPTAAKLLEHPFLRRSLDAPSV